MNLEEMEKVPAGTPLTLARKGADGLREFVRVEFVRLQDFGVTPGRMGKRAIVDMPEGEREDVSIYDLRRRCVCGALQHAGCFCELNLSEFLATGQERTP